MKVSVVLCSYNGEKYIEEQLKSIVNQSVKPDEIIVCDDRSTDNTVAIVNKVLSQSSIDYKIKINERNMGVIKNFEHAIELATGDIIFLSDQDDVWHYKKIETIKREFEKDESCIMVFTDAELVDKERKKLGVNLWRTVHFSEKMLSDNNLIDILLNRPIVTGATMAFRKELFEKIRPFPEWCLHDEWIAINASVYGSVKAIEFSLIEYRQHESNLVGAYKTLYDRAKRYFNSIKVIEDIRHRNYNKYKAFYEMNYEILAKRKKAKEVYNCVQFWYEMKQLSKADVIRGLIIIFRNYFRGNYKKYYTGIRGVIRDILYVAF